jgi:hypothetical protein
MHFRHLEASALLTYVSEPHVRFVPQRTENPDVPRVHRFPAMNSKEGNHFDFVHSRMMIITIDACPPVRSHPGNHA